MGKVKIKKQSTIIDMTAMSDVTVLLLTFFMLTSTFLQKEPRCPMRNSCKFLLLPMVRFIWA